MAAALLSLLVNYSHVQCTTSTTYQDLAANLVQFFLDLLPVFGGHFFFEFFRALLLDAGDDPPRAAARAHHVLVGHAQEISLVVV